MSERNQSQDTRAAGGDGSRFVSGGRFFDRRLLKLLSPGSGGSETPQLALVVLGGVLNGLLVAAQAWLLSRVIAGVFLGGQGMEAVSPALLALLAVFGGRAGLAYGVEAAAGSAAILIKQRVRRMLAQHLLALGPVYASRERTGELSAAATAGVEALDAYFRQYLPQVALAALVPVLILAVVFPLEPLSAVVLLLTGPLIPLFMVLIGSMGERLTRRQWTALSRMSAHFLDSLQGLETLKLLGQSRARARSIEAAGERYRDATMRVLRVTFLSALALELAATLSTAVIAVQIGLRLLYGQLDYQQALFVLVLAPEFYLPLRSLGARFHAGMAGVSAARRIFDVLETPLPETGTAKPTGVHGAPGIVFEAVSYTYPGSTEPALSRLSFEIESGQRAALVGPSGAGKSTVFSLLLGFIQPTEGRILIDGQPLADVQPEAWRKRVAWVPQNPYLFNTTLLENIRLGRPGAERSDVLAAARLAHVDEFTRGLPQGYDTPVGEHGARLSGGQRQRVALARAFLRGAPLLLLDEPGTALDPENDALVQEAVNRLSEERTVVTIAHRLASVRRADRIIVLGEGGMKAAGTHDELAASSEAYRAMVEGSREG